MLKRTVLLRCANAKHETSPVGHEKPSRDFHWCISKAPVTLLVRGLLPYKKAVETNISQYRLSRLTE